MCLEGQKLWEGTLIVIKKLPEVGDRTKEKAAEKIAVRHYAGVVPCVANGGQRASRWMVHVGHCRAVSEIAEVEIFLLIWLCMREKMRGKEKMLIRTAWRLLGMHEERRGDGYALGYLGQSLIGPHLKLKGRKPIWFGLWHK